MNCDILALGPLSLDTEEFTFNGMKRSYVGGAVPFAIHAATVAGKEVCGLIKSAPEDFHILEDLPAKKMYFAASAQTTRAEAIYYTENKERRDIFLSAQVDPITVEDIPEVTAKVYHMAGIYHGDYDDALFSYFSKRGMLACDIQCYVRYLEDKEIVFHDWADKLKYIPHITFLKADAREAEVLTGTDDREDAAKMIVSWGAKEVMITHNTEVILYDGHRIHRYPLRPKCIEGRAGRGDTTFASYIAMRLDHDVSYSLLYAAAAVSLKMESTGPLSVSRDVVENYIEERYPEFNGERMD